jgi:DNA-directed RNA polymerase subunit M/transcription elongation factor TFIIS
MTTDRPGASATPHGLRALVYEVLPPGASPTDTLCQPLHRHVLEKSQGDVLELTREKVRQQFGDTPNVVITLRENDLDPDTDSDVYGLLKQTDGGTLVFGVAYVEDDTRGDEKHQTRSQGALPVNADDSCPECGSTDAFEVKRAENPDANGRTQVLLECRGCGAVWDSYAQG